MRKLLVLVFSLALALSLALTMGCKKAEEKTVEMKETATQAQKAKAAENKAEVLEKNAASEGSKALPSPPEIITKTEAQAVDPVGEEPLKDAITCLSRTIYWEAKNEGVAGMEAIANVVMNRLGHKGFPNKICEVVRQGREQGACQFSWWCDGRSDDAEEDKPYAIAKEISRKALNRQLPTVPVVQCIFTSGKLPPVRCGIHQDGRDRRAYLLQASQRLGKISPKHSGFEVDDDLLRARGFRPGSDQAKRLNS